MSLSLETLTAMQDSVTQTSESGLSFGSNTESENQQNSTKSPNPKKEDRIKEIEHKLLVLLMVRAGVSGLGTIGGWVYANKTGGGFWRYVGFGIMGGIAFGTLSFIATIPSYSKLDKELKDLQ
jgi:hypothetical protein